MRAFVERVLGKGAVVAKDTPNFIANRPGQLRRHARRPLRPGARLLDRGGRRPHRAAGGPAQDGHLPAVRPGRAGRDGRGGGQPARARPRPTRAATSCPPPSRCSGCWTPGCSATRPAAASTAAAGATARPCSTCSTWTAWSTGRRPGPTCRSSPPPATTTTWGPPALPARQGRRGPRAPATCATPCCRRWPTPPAGCPRSPTPWSRSTTPSSGASATGWGRSGPGTPSGWPTGWPAWRPWASRSRPGCARCWPPGTTASTATARSTAR
jgi:hypothetical protein